jgi:hypothetical protein
MSDPSRFDPAADPFGAALPSEGASPSRLVSLPPLSRYNPFLAGGAARSGAHGPGVRVYGDGAEASFNGIEIWITQIQQTIENRGTGHKYYRRSGQTVEWTGTEPINTVLTSEWYGDDWNARRQRLQYEARTNPFGELRVPDDPVTAAFLRKVDVDRNPVDGTCRMEITFEQNDHADADLDDTIDPMLRAEQALPAAVRRLIEAQLDAYQDALDEPATPAPALRSALRAFDSAIVGRMALADPMRLSGVQALDGLILARAYARRAAPMGTL